VLIEDLDEGYFVGVVAVLKEGEESKGDGGQQLCLVFIVFEDDLVDLQDSRMHSRWQGRIQTLSKSLAERDLVR
jgi:hypothetical protein